MMIEPENGVTTELPAGKSTNGGGIDTGSVSGTETENATAVEQNQADVNLEEAAAVQGVTPLRSNSYYAPPRSLEGVITVGNQANRRLNNDVIKSRLEKLTTKEVCPFINAETVGKPNARARKTSKLESVGIYKTIDLISEGPIAGLCDSSGNLIPIIEGDAPSNENMLKGVYLNDIPVINTYGGTINYQRIHSEIKYGILYQGLLQDHKQKSLSFLRSSQTFSIGLTLPGLNATQAVAFVFIKDDVSGLTVPFLPKSNTSLKTVGIAPVEASAGTGAVTGAVSAEAPVWDNAYDIHVHKDKSAKNEDGSTLANQPVTTGEGANDVAIYTGDTKDIERDIVTRIRKVFKEQPVVFHHAITNDNVTDIEVSLKVDALSLRWANSGDGSYGTGPMNNTIIFLIKVGYEQSDKMIGEGGDTFYAMAPISGLSTSSYQRSYTFPLPVPSTKDRRISVCLASEEPSPEIKAIGAVQRSGGVATITEIIEDPLTFPHSAVMATLIDARSFVRVPKRTYNMKLLKIKIPANYDSENREYSGNWTGQWAAYKQWSDNPAWVFYDMMTSRRYGLKKFGFGENIVDKWNLYSIAKYCDELVETGYRPSNTPLSFSIDAGGSLVSITDTGGILKSAGMKARFPEGAIVSLYKLKDKDGVAIDQGYHRRLGNSSYDESTKIFSFSIHKIINPEYVFETYEGLRGLWYEEVNELAGDDKLTAEQWIFRYLNREIANNSNSDIVQDYTGGFSIGPTSRTGIVTQEIAGHPPVLEPRFSTNIYLDRQQDAMNLLNDLAAVFRGMVYWNSGFVFISNDQFREPVMLFNNSNVRDGVFTYTGSSKSTRFTSVLIRYNDASDSYKPKVEYVEDASSIRKYGYLEKKIVGLGTTSRSQAYRLGKWFLFTNQLETDLIQFKAGIESTYLRPGDVIKVQDSLKNTKRYGGRIKDISQSSYQLTLDKGVYEDVVGQKITLIVPAKSRSVDDLNAEASTQIAVDNFSGIPQEKIDETRETQIQQFTIAAVSGSDASSGGAQNNLITVEEAEGFGKVAVGTIWSMQNTSTEVNITEVSYRIISITEETAGEYSVTAMMYESSKFGAVDESRDLAPTQQSAPSSVPTGPLAGAIDWDALIDPTQYDVTQGDPVPIGNKTPESDSGASVNEGEYEESIKKVRLLLDLSATLVGLLQQLQKNNQKTWDSLGRKEPKAPRSGSIIISQSSSGEFVEGDAFWTFWVNRDGVIYQQTSGYSLAGRQPNQSLSISRTINGVETPFTAEELSRYRKIRISVPEGTVQLQLVIKLQDYNKGVEESSTIKQIPTP